jgi:hypothetical protein
LVDKHLRYCLEVRSASQIGLDRSHPLGGHACAVLGWLTPHWTIALVHFE